MSSSQHMLIGAGEPVHLSLKDRTQETPSEQLRGVGYVYIWCGQSSEQKKVQGKCHKVRYQLSELQVFAEKHRAAEKRKVKITGYVNLITSVSHQYD